MAKVWKLSDRGAEVVRATEGSTARISGTVDGAEDSFGTRPTNSMMSISPVCGQPTSPMLVPRLQNAGRGRRPPHLDARLDAPIGEFGFVLGTNRAEVN
jgi:hypothetical protein